MTSYLTIGYILDNDDHSGEYIIKKVIGRGASTIAYLTDFEDSSGRVAERILKEFYPSYLDIMRDSSGELSCSERDLQKYQEGINRFIAVGDRQNDLRKRTYLTNETPPILKIFKANNTCYLEVTPFKGKTFDNIESFTLLERMKLCLTTAKLINRYHEEGLLYLDIKPENIFVLTNSSGEVVTDMVELIDFDSVIEKEKVVFGKSLSFTETWAAPEQITPYGFSKISERTDVFTLGELVFWCVFDRHSTTAEHRGFSVYPFNDLKLDNGVSKFTKTAEMILIKLFRGTLRSSTQNRFQKMGDVISLLDKLVDELGKKEVICRVAIRPEDVFIGRELELQSIKELLHNHNTVFVSGILGIGKSAIIKQYAYYHQNSYSNIIYWQYDGNLISMVCDEGTVFIDNFNRYPKEEDIDYCYRKLKKLVSLSDDNTLIIIDNVDVLVEEFEPKKVWHLIQSIPGKLLIGTRCDEPHYRQVKIEEIKDIGLLKKNFFEHCHFTEMQADDVENIIRLANYHTYEIALLASYTKAKRQLPKDTLEEMNKFGFSSFENTSISVLKDGDSLSTTYSNHLIKLITMSQLSENQQNLLLKMAFLPVTGISVKEIKAFYSMPDLNNLNWLISHGLVSITSDDTHVVSVHPSVSQIVISIAKNNPDLLKNFYDDALIAMRKGYDDASVNQAYYEKLYERYINDKEIVAAIKKEIKKNSQVEFKKKNEEIKNEIQFILKSEYSSSGVSQKEYKSFCISISEKTVKNKIHSKNAAHFLTQYVEWFAKFGHFSTLKKLIEVALKIYNEKNDMTYNPDREYAYFVYAELLLVNSKDYEEVIKISLQHLSRSKIAKDWETASDWCINLSKAYFSVEDHNAYMYQLRYIYYVIRYLLQRKNHRKNFDNSFSYNMSKRSIRYAELLEKMSDLYPRSDCNIITIDLLMAIFSRKRIKDTYSTNNLSENRIRIAIDQSQISISKLRFDDAREKLNMVIGAYKKGNYQITLALINASELLGDVLMVQEKFFDAIDIYKFTLDIAKKLDETDTMLIRVKIGRALNMSMQLEEAKKYNRNILNQIKHVEHETMRHILADAYYNVADNDFLSGNYNIAIEKINLALSLYESSTLFRVHNNIGKARCYERLARIAQKTNNSINGKEHMQKAVSLLEEMLGSRHPEVINFRSGLKALEE